MVGPASAPTASLRRSSGCSAPANVDGRGDRRHERDAGAGEGDPRADRPVRARPLPPGDGRPQHGAGEQHRHTPRPQRQVVPRPAEDAGHRHRAEHEPGADHDVQRPQRRWTDTPGDDRSHRPHDQRDAPRHADVVSTKRPVPVTCMTTPPQTSRWRKASRMPSLNPSGVSGGEPKWSTSWRMLPGSSVNWSATGGNHSTTPMPVPHAMLRTSTAERPRSPAGRAMPRRPRRARPCRHRGRDRARGSGRNTRRRRRGPRTSRGRRRAPPTPPAARGSMRAAGGRGSTAGSAAAARSRARRGRAARRRLRRRAIRAGATRSTATRRSPPSG